MRSLLEEGFAPITSSIGFLEVGLDDAASGLERWRRRLYPQVEVVRPTEGFPSVLRRLQPLIAGARPRELMVAAGGWTAYFDCLLRGTDAVTAISYLSRELHCRGLAIKAIPHTAGIAGRGRGRSGAVQFQMFGPEPTGFMNFIRAVSLVFSPDPPIPHLTDAVRGGYGCSAD